MASEITNEHGGLPIPIKADSFIPGEAEVFIFICAMFPEGFRIPVEYLIIYGMGIKLFKDVDNMFEERHKVHALIKIINDRVPPYYMNKLYLWEDKYRNQYVQVLDCAYDFVESIASKYKVAFGYETVLEKWLNTSMYERCYGLSLVLKRIREHHVNLECPKLLMLQLQYREDSKSLPIDFFQGMKNLQLLSLDVPSVSQSVSVLQNLHTLCLKVLKLEDMSWIGGLINLEFLSISTLNVGAIPREMGQLENLRILDLRKMNLAYIPTGVLSRMLKLKELYLPISFIRWGSMVEDGKDYVDEERINVSISELDDGERINASLGEIKSLSLNALQISIPNVSVLPKNSPMFKSIRHFKILMPNNLLYQQFDKDSINELQLTGDTCDIKESGICDLMNKTEELRLTRVKNLKNVMYQLEDIDFKQLKKMMISECDELEYVVDATKTRIPSEDGDLFWNLESLHLSMLSNLKEIWHGKWTNFQWFQNLSQISIRFCHKLKYVFPQSIVRGWKILKSIEILDCKEIEGIFYHDNGDDNPYIIEELNLHSLPKFVGFFVQKDSTIHDSDQSSATNEVVLNSMEGSSVSIDDGNFQCSSITDSCNDEEEYPPVPISVCRWKLQQNATQKLFFNKQVSLMKSEDMMSHLEMYSTFSPIAKKGLESLKRLKISYCDALKAIFLLEENHVATSTYSSLEELELCGLRNLMHIWFQISPAMIGFQNLQLLVLFECHNLYVFSAQVVKLLVRLQKIHISRCEKMEEIIAKDNDKSHVEEKIVFSQLKLLELQHVPNLKIFSSGIYAIELPLLESLIFHECKNMKSFSHGSLKTPKLKRIGINRRSHSLLMGDLNATIKRYMGNYFEDPSTDASPSFTISTIVPPTPGQANNNYNTTTSIASSSTSSCVRTSQLYTFASEADPMGQQLEAPNYMKEFTLVDLKIATQNFSSEFLLGEGFCGKVYKGWLNEKTFAPSKIGTGMVVAIKKLNSDSMQEFERNNKFLERISHPNLVRLLGMCWEEEQVVLVSEFMQRGSLEYQLFGRNEALSWNMRLKIAIEAARALAFLHTSRKVFFGIFRPSNILLDGNNNVKLSDFGLARLSPSAVELRATTTYKRTLGYIDPWYFITGYFTKESDVYGFGMVLLELMTGLKALDITRPKGKQYLADWLKPILAHEEKLQNIMDKRMEGQYSVNAMLLIAELVFYCLQSEGSERPSMGQVVEKLMRIDAIKEKSDYVVLMQEMKSIL